MRVWDGTGATLAVALATRGLCSVGAVALWACYGRARSWCTTSWARARRVPARGRANTPDGVHRPRPAVDGRAPSGLHDARAPRTSASPRATRELAGLCLPPGGSRPRRTRAAPPGARPRHPVTAAARPTSCSPRHAPPGGFSVLLMDLRDHGDSDGDDCRFAGGSEEYLDVLGGWDWVAAQGVPRSASASWACRSGSVNAIIAGGQEPRVRRSGRTRRRPDSRGDRPVPRQPAPRRDRPVARARARGAPVGADHRRRRPDRLRADRGGRRLRGPSIAFVHGADAALLRDLRDELHDRAVAAGADTPDRWVVPGAGHTEAVYVDPRVYEPRLVAFFTAALGAP